MFEIATFRKSLFQRVDTYENFNNKEIILLLLLQGCNFWGLSLLKHCGEESINLETMYGSTAVMAYSWNLLELVNQMNI